VFVHCLAPPLRRRWWAAWAGAALVVAGVSAQAQSQQVVDLPTRPGVTERMLVLQPPQATAVVVLLTGGNGEVGIADDGSVARRGNFLVRSRERFVRAGLDTIVLDVPSDRSAPPFLDGNFRASAEHAADIGAAVRWAREQFGRKVWLVGTSRGTQSAAAAALVLTGPAAPDGLVLSSTILRRSARGRVTVAPVPEMDLGKLTQPVLVVHHAQDPCPLCDPAGLPALMAKFAPGQATLLTYTGGRSMGPACEAHSHHGYNGIEDQVVADIGAWIAARK
jgi:pimeloyl-ACP methyl ester carboxylesterase